MRRRRDPSFNHCNSHEGNLDDRPDRRRKPALELWVIYRLVIGAVKLNENQPIVEAKFGLAA